MKRFAALCVSSLVVLIAGAPASASASQTFDFSAAEPTATGTFGTVVVIIQGGEPIDCTGENHVKTRWASGNTRITTFTFTNCHTESGIACTTSGQSSGTLVSGEMTGHNRRSLLGKILNLFTSPGTGVVLQFSCSIFANIKIAGNGVIGEITSPKCGGTSGSTTSSFTASGATQTYQEVEGEATKYHLTGSLNGGAAAEAAWVMEYTETFAGGVTGTLTCT